jgi:hypothetical protein
VRRPAAPALLALALLALAGCGAKPHPGTPAQRQAGAAPPGPQAEIQALLDRRAAALRSGDAAAYAATGAGAQRGPDRRAARIAAGLPLRDVVMRLRSADVRGRTARIRLAASWGLTGVRGTFEAERHARLVRRAGRWRIAAVRADRGAPPWEVAPYAQRRLAHFAVLAPRGLPIDALDLPAALEDGHRRLREAIPRAALRNRYLVVVAPTAAAARRMTVGIRGVEGLAAISDSAVHEIGPARRISEVVSQRLLVVWPSFTSLDGDARRRVVAHELTHAVLAGSTSGRTPSWLVEGIALYLSGDDRRDQVAAVLAGRAGQTGSEASTAFTLRGLSEPNAIARLDGPRQAGAYAWASAVAFTIAELHGRRALLRLYDAFNEESLRGPAGAALTDRALRRTTGEGLAALEREIRARLS